MKKTVRSVIAFLVLSSVYVAYNTPLAALPESIKIGLVVDFSGVSRPYTTKVLAAATLTIQSWNAQGGINGKTVELLSRDGGTDPERHALHVKDLVRNRKAVVILGGASSPAVQSASDACCEVKTPYLVSIGNAQSIFAENGHPFLFHFQPTLSMETKAFSIFATMMPWRRYAWVGPDYSWGRSILSDFKTQFRSIGASLQWTSEGWHPLGTADFTPIINNILADKPDALLIASWGEDAIRFINQAKKKNLFSGVAVFGWFTYDTTSELGTTVPSGMWCLARGGPFNYLAETYPTAKSFTKEFYEQNAVFPNGYAIACHDSLLAWRQAVAKAGTSEPQAVAHALKGLRFTGLRGKRYIRSADGQINCPTYFGKLLYSLEYPFAVWESVMEIPASKTWLREEEILRLRRKKDRTRQQTES